MTRSQSNVVRIKPHANRHAEAFKDLEPDICDLVRAVDIA